jgi:DNA-binding transcriptional MerR regulator
VRDDSLLNIGAFSVLTGLSIPTLRHYDDVGLLLPVAVDTNSGYRRYGLEQVGIGRLIRALRAVDMPIDAMRDAVAASGLDATRSALVEHRSRLAGRRQAVTEMIATLDDYIENGVPMAEQKGCRVAEINLGVADLDEGRRFYEAVFAVEFTEERHDDGPRHLFAAFGSWPSDEFFLLNLSDGSHDPHRAGRADFGFLVDDLDAVHKRAIKAGGTELMPPRHVSGMPRTSTIVDPSGNLINLYQNA